LDVVRRREARAGSARASARPYVEVISGASDSAAVVEVRAGDRAGLLYALGQALTERRLAIRSAHIATLAGQAIDTFYVTEADGSAPTGARAELAAAALLSAAGLDDGHSALPMPTPAPRVPAPD
jgi:[protein-PII] uridylyltransferase